MKLPKKNPYIFTIGFDKKNSEHIAAVEILNQTDKKAALIAAAILQYTKKGASPGIGMTQEEIQVIIREQIRKELERLAENDRFPTGEKGRALKREEPGIQNLSDSEELPLDENMMKEVVDAMSAFRKL